MTDRLIRITTTLAVVAVAVVAAIISYQHAYEAVRSHGESGTTARLLPFTVDGLIWAASMVVLDASRRNQPVPRLAAWSPGAGIVATVGANLAHGLGHGPVGALVSAWPALALVGSFELGKIHATQAGPPATDGTGPAVTRASLHADLLAAHERALRLTTRIQQLEKRLSEVLGDQAWRESGLGAPADIDALNHKIADLEQQIIDLRLQLEERDSELAAARAANRELMAQLNAASRR